MVFKETALLGAGALFGGIIGATTQSQITPLPFSPQKHQYSVEPDRPRGEFEFTYYYDRHLGAFNKVALSHIEMLKARGYVVHKREIHDWLVDFKHKPEWTNDFGIVHPLFYTTRTKALQFLAKCHRYVVAVEVADTTHISEAYVRYANDPRINAIFLPSIFAINTFHYSGVINRVWHVPHGLHYLYEVPPDKIHTENLRLKRLREKGRVKILAVVMHSAYRKGVDIMIKALLRIPRQRYILVVKTFPPPMSNVVLGEFQRHAIPVYPVSEWLSEEDMIYLYDSCDIFLSPHRGGAFELCPFEAMARGLPTIVTGWGCVLDYANIHNAYLIKPKRLVRVFSPLSVPHMHGHIGFGVDPDVDHCAELLQFVMDNLDYCKKKAQAKRGTICSIYNWDKTVEAFITGCSEVWARD
jgi:glycosyltransferase involved in cell wall biosynthesis